MEAESLELAEVDAFCADADGALVMLRDSAARTSRVASNFIPGSFSAL